MHPQQLIGQFALRTKPVRLGGISDTSYLTDPIFIRAVTENHIVFERKTTIGTATNQLLDYRWIDNNWASYDELIHLASDKHMETMKELNKLTAEINSKEDNINEI